MLSQTGLSKNVKLIQMIQEKLQRYSKKNWRLLNKYLFKKVDIKEQFKYYVSNKLFPETRIHKAFEKNSSFHVK